MSNKGKLTPKLRFPEFRQKPGWEPSKLGQVVDFHSGGTPSKADPAFWNGDVPWVSAKDMKHPVLNDTEDHITSAAVANGANPVPTGTVLMLTRGMTLLKDVPICVLGRPMAFNQDVKALRAKGELDGRFLAWLLLGNKERLLKMVDVAGHGTGKLNTDELRAFEISVPSPSEQQKIADCLSSLDDLIAAEGRKLGSLRAYKKGLMQQLFPRDGETVPQRRFPEFRKGRGWEKQIISSILSKVANPVTVEPNKLYREIGIRSHGKGIFHKEPIGGNVIADKRVFWVVQDAFVVNIVFAWEQAVATTSQAEAGMIASHRFPMYISRQERCDIRFISRIFQSKKGKYLLGLASPGGAGRNRTLGQKEFEKLEIVVPEKVEEQRKIADCLSSLDSQIAVQSEWLDALRAHKKGLMQQLFPAAKEVKA